MICNCKSCTVLQCICAEKNVLKSFSSKAADKTLIQLCSMLLIEHCEGCSYNVGEANIDHDAFKVKYSIESESRNE